MSIMVKAGGGSGGNKYTGPNPLTIGADGYSFAPKTLLKDGLTIVNGVEGEDLTATEADMALAITELQRMVARKISENLGEGEYVWKKYGKVIVAGDVIATCIGAGSAISWQLSATNGSLKSLTKKDLVGLKLTNSTNVSQYLNIDSETSSTWRFSASYTYTQEWTYDDATKTITVPTNVGGSVGDKYNVSGVTFNVESLTFVDFVVSDDETAYPDGAEQDGYWYELVSEGITPEMFGCTKMAIDKFTFTEDTTTKTAVSHSLDEVPKYVLVLAKNVKYSSANDYLISAFIVKYNAYPNFGFYQFYDNNSIESYQPNVKTDSTPSVTANAISTGTTLYYQAGIEHTLITMA